MNLNGVEIDLADLNNKDLSALLELPHGKGGLRHYMPKGDKLRYIESLDEAERESILAHARSIQKDHHLHLRGRRKEGFPNRQLRIEQLMGEDVWRFVASQRMANGFKDDVTGRKARIAFIVENTNTGARLHLTRSTLDDAYERLGVVTGWPPHKGRERAKEAAAVGLVTGAHVRSTVADLRA